MKGFERLIEERIAAAAARGEFARLPGSGRPLDFGDDALVPEDQRMAMHVLRNAGFVPPEVQRLGEAQRLLSLCEQHELEGPDRLHTVRRLEALLHRLEQDGLRSVSQGMLLRYQAALLQRMHKTGAIPDGAHSRG